MMKSLEMLSKKFSVKNVDVNREVRFTITDKVVEKNHVVLWLKIDGCNTEMIAVVSPVVQHDIVKIVGGRWVLVSDMQSLAEAAKLFRNRDRRFWSYEYPWTELAV